MKVLHTSGSRKMAVARVTFKPGVGKVKLNGVLLDYYQPHIAKLKIMEPFMLGGDKVVKKYDIIVKTYGGGVLSQAEAARLAIAKGMVQLDKTLEKEFLDYDRNLLVADIRQRETRKPFKHGKARGKVQKSKR